MAKDKIKFSTSCGFTLIELLVVISIIALLVGILVPGMRGATRLARNLRQKSHFHAIDIALEFFRDYYGDYPDSAVLPSPTAGGNLICGSQHLVEGVFGRDLKGFDPKSTWYAPDDRSDTEIYANSEKGSTAEEIEASKNRREGPYLELKKELAVYMIEQIYKPDIDLYSGPVYSSASGSMAPVITDVFVKKSIEVNSKKIKVGPPVLYYKADSSSRLWPVTPDASMVGQYIYNFEDNDPIVQLNLMDDLNTEHELDMDKFYEMVTNPKLRYDGPHNPNTYILISAGWDGIYGTKDDVKNFN